MKAILTIMFGFVILAGSAQEKKVELKKGNVISLIAAHYHSRGNTTKSQCLHQQGISNGQ